MEHAVAINPANPALKADFGIFLTRVGRAEEALQWLRSARSADPFFGPAWFWQQLGFAQLMLRRYADALADFEREAPKNADTLAMMAGCCAKLGVMERANRLVTECLEVQPEATLHDLVERTPLAQAADSEHFAECLRLAGMPE
jgi:adenylate cyclase